MHSNVFLLLPPLSSPEVSFYLQLHVQRGTVIQNTEKTWNDEVIKAIGHLRMDPWMVAEVKEGLDLGQQVDLPSHLTFSPPLLASLFVYERHVRPFLHLRYRDHVTFYSS